MNSDVVMMPDSYYPSLDNNGNYIDNILPLNFKKKGITCPYGSRKDKIYSTQGAFNTHTKSVSHHKWLTNMNLNKANYYIENVKLNDLVQSQRLIIAKLENDLNNRNMTVDYLTQQLNKQSNNKNVNDLLEFD
uniref:Uncharacterized protein n=1 Tax=viral metagenome TaxID=1070528 RepID=A0A6C0KW69_9ZZZZ